MLNAFVCTIILGKIVNIFRIFTKFEGAMLHNAVEHYKKLSSKRISFAAFEDSVKTLIKMTMTTVANTVFEYDSALLNFS